MGFLSLLTLIALAAPAPPKLRLPAGVHPTRMALDLTIIPGQPRFSGKVDIDLALDAPTTLVWLNATELTVDAAELRAGGTIHRARVVPVTVVA